MNQSPYYRPTGADFSHETIANISRWFQKAKPAPTSNDITTQLGVHFEEVGEMLGCFFASSMETATLLEQAQTAFYELSQHLKQTENAVCIAHHERTEFLDALCDQIVTAVGCGVMMDMDVFGGLREVSNSNDSKFDPETQMPILDENGKIMKGPAYAPPSLGRYV